MIFLISDHYAGLGNFAKSTTTEQDFKMGVISETFDGRALRKSSVLSENQKMENF